MVVDWFRKAKSFMCKRSVTTHVTVNNQEQEVVFYLISFGFFFVELAIGWLKATD
jgi:hypothetical protein